MLSLPLRPLIAVDGPAASGKGTVARALARHFNVGHLDTGKLYRAVGLAVRLQGADPRDATAAAAVAVRLDAALLDDPDLMSADNAESASIVSAHPAVRTALLARQRDFAAAPHGAVLDGRDIGTVIAPAAAAKLFVTAAPEVRAARRAAELAGSGRPLPFGVVLADIRARDARDIGRATAPLIKAANAVLLDTSDLTIEVAVARAIAIVEARLRGD